MLEWLKAKSLAWLNLRRQDASWLFWFCVDKLRLLGLAIAASLQAFYRRVWAENRATKIAVRVLTEMVKAFKTTLSTLPFLIPYVPMLASIPVLGQVILPIFSNGYFATTVIVLGVTMIVGWATYKEVSERHRLEKQITDDAQLLQKTVKKFKAAKNDLKAVKKELAQADKKLAQLERQQTDLIDVSATLVHLQTSAPKPQPRNGFTSHDHYQDSSHRKPKAATVQ